MSTSLQFLKAEHHQKTRHKILFVSTSIVTKSPYYFTQKIQKSIEIISHPNKFNREPVNLLSIMWKIAIKTNSGHYTMGGRAQILTLRCEHGDTHLPVATREAKAATTERW